MEKLKFSCSSEYDKVLNYVKMLAMMMFPESEEEQKEVQITALAHISDDEGELDYNGIIRDLGGYKALSASRSYEELMKIMHKKEKEWYTVFKIISNLEKMKYNSEAKINDKASLSKAYYLTDLHNKKLDDMPINRVRIIRLWEYYKPVAHFIYAYCKHAKMLEKRSEGLVNSNWGYINSLFISAYDISEFLLNFQLPVVKKPMIDKDISYPINFEELSKDEYDWDVADLMMYYGKTFTDEERKELLKYRAGKSKDQPALINS